MTARDVFVLIATVTVAVMCVTATSTFYEGDPIVYEDGLNIAKGDVNAFHASVRAYTASLRGAMTQIEASAAERDWEVIREHARDLEKASEAVGARGTRLFAEQLKILSRVKRPGKLGPCIKQLNAEVDSLIAFVRDSRKFEPIAAATKAEL